MGPAQESVRRYQHLYSGRSESDRIDSCRLVAIAYFQLGRLSVNEAIHYDPLMIGRRVEIGEDNNVPDLPVLKESLDVGGRLTPQSIRRKNPFLPQP